MEARWKSLYDAVKRLDRSNSSKRSNSQWICNQLGVALSEAKSPLAWSTTTTPADPLYRWFLLFQLPTLYIPSRWMKLCENDDNKPVPYLDVRCVCPSVAKEWISFARFAAEARDDIASPITQRVLDAIAFSSVLRGHCVRVELRRNSSAMEPTFSVSLDVPVTFPLSALEKVLRDSSGHPCHFIFNVLWPAQQAIL